MSFKEVAPGGKFIFVMIAPVSVEADVRFWNEETAAGIREIRRVYYRNGMYRNDGSTEPLWTVDWYAYGVEIAPDGVHLIRPGPWAGLPKDRGASLRTAFDQVALSFYADGRLLKTYRIGELVDDPVPLHTSVSHFTWRRDGGLNGNFEYWLATLDGNRFTFDVRTGEIVSSLRVGRATWWGWRVVPVAAIASIVVWLLRRRWRGTKAATA